MPCAHCERIARVADDALRDAARALRATTRERDALARELARARETVTETQRAANDALVAALEAATRRGGAEAFARDRAERDEGARRSGGVRRRRAGADDADGTRRATERVERERASSMRSRR